VSTSDLAVKLAGYLQNQLPMSKNLSIKNIQRIHGGASRVTCRFKLIYSIDSNQIEKPLIVRIDPERSLVESEHAKEFYAYQAFYGTCVPVPEPLWLEEDHKWLGRPFFIMQEIEDCEAERSKINISPYIEVREKIGEQYSRILGQISRIDPAQIGLLDKMEVPTPDECWRKELDYWEGMIDQDEMEPQPVVRAAIRRLRRQPPPPAQKICVVHGDYRLGNFLYNRNGDILAILDWEMCHLGDPMEDITYGMNTLWSANEPNLVGNMINRERYIDLWQAESGLSVDPEALKWWELFTNIKSISIWIDAARKFSDEKNNDIILGHTGWIATEVQSFIMQNLMGQSS